MIRRRNNIRANTLTASGTITSTVPSGQDAFRILDLSKRIRFRTDGLPILIGNDPLTGDTSAGCALGLNFTTNGKLTLGADIRGSVATMNIRAGGSALVAAQITNAGLTLPNPIKFVMGFGDLSGTPGSGSFNRPSGKAAMAAGASSITVTNSLVRAASIVHITPLDLDTTVIQYKVVPTGGSFTVTSHDAAGAAANATANWRFNWVVLN